jgi:uncharacterized membrane protein YeaQ/YmgE (transglycosylase-associated protein family)
MGIVSWVILGALSGWIVSMIVKTNEKQGFVGNVVVGVVGALVGGFLGSKLFDVDVSGVNLKSVLLAVAGGLIFVTVLSFFTGKKTLGDGK